MTYDEITRYPVAYRKAIQAKLPMAVRREMWLTQLRLYETSDLLSPIQKIFIHKAQQPFAEILSDETSPSRREQIGDSLNLEAAKVLSRSLHHAIFFVLGPDDPAEATGADGSVTPTFFLAALRHPVRVPKEESNCTCHQSVHMPPPECSVIDTCADATCTVSQGCGTGGAYACNGRCGDRG